MKKYIIAVFALLISLAGVAQNKDGVIFRAMQDELSRNMNELRMDNVGAPFFLSYIYCDVPGMYILASLGQIISSRDITQRINATRILLGDYGTTSDLNYNGAYTLRGGAIETDEAQIRREFWLSTDAAYKGAASDMARKLALRRQNARTPEEELLPDLLPTPGIEKIVETPAFELDRTAWEKRTKELSAVFADFPSLYGSRVQMGASDWANYVVSSEGVRVKHPAAYAYITVTAAVRTADGKEFSDSDDIYATSDMTLPSQEELLAWVRRFAQRLAGYAEASEFGDFYSGPVLFVGQPVFRMFNDNLLSTGGNGLLVRRKPETEQGGQSARRLENRLGQRILDRRLGVVNHSTTLHDWNGVPLLGYYEIDADGVVPAPSLTIVEEGMLRTLLSGQIPTLKSPASTGSRRFSIQVNPFIAPGVLEISTTEGETTEELERRLVALAAADGLECAYIVERMSGRVNLVWRVDVETGDRELVRGAEVTPVTLTQLKRVAGIAENSEMRNYLAGQVPASMIYPSALLLEDVEIGAAETTGEKPSPIVNPLQRN